MTADADSKRADGLGGYRLLRALESVALVVALVGLLLFAWCLVDIVRIETAPGAEATTVETREIPPTAWPGVFAFFGGMIGLQVVRVTLGGHRRADGSPRADARGRAADATAAALAEAEAAADAGRPETTALYSDDTDASAS